MPSLAARSPAVRILQSLTDTGRLPSPFASVLVSSPNPFPIAVWVSSHDPHHTYRTERLYADRVRDRNEDFALGILASLKAPASSSRVVAEDPPAARQVVVLSTSGPTLSGSKDSSIVCAPLSLSQLADAVRNRAGVTRRRYVDAVPAAGHQAASPELLQLGLDDNARVRAVEECAAAFCPRSSFDLIVVEAAPGEGPGADVDEEALAADVEDSLLASPHLLTPSGSLLLMVSSSILAHLNTRYMNRFARWRYREALWAKRRFQGVDDITFLLCTSLTGDSTAATLNDADFPGFRPAGSKRERHWNPRAAPGTRGGRGKGNFIASLRPSFTSAQRIAGTMRTTMLREERERQKSQEHDEAFFGVAHDMVAKGTHYTKPEN